MTDDATAKPHREPDTYPLDANGVAICPPRTCKVCDQSVGTRPDGTLRSHGRMRSQMHPRLGVEACPGATPRSKP